MSPRFSHARTLALLAVCLTIAGLGWRREWLDTAATEAAENLVAGTSRYESLAHSVLPGLVRATRFEDRWRVNVHPEGDAVTILLFRSDGRLPRPLAPYERNCGYTGHRPIVICDVRAIEWLESHWRLDRVPLGPSEIPAEVVRPYQRTQPCDQVAACGAILTWLLGHEIGHIIAGHGASSFSHSRIDNQVATSSISQERELEADDFLVRQLGTPSSSAAFYRLVTDALNAEIRLKLCPTEDQGQVCRKIPFGVGLHFSYSDLIEYSTSGTHPEFAVRTVRLLGRAEKRYEMEFYGPLVGRLTDEFMKPRTK